MGKISTFGRLIVALLPEAIVARLHPKRDIYRGEMIDPKAYAIGKYAEHLRPAEEIPPLEEGRQLLRDVGAKLDSKVKLARVEDLMLDGAEGPIKARLYSDDAGKKAAPALLYFHGGGFIQGDIESHHNLCAKMAKLWGGTVISVEYRLAPEHPFPAGPRDCTAAFLAVHDRAEALGIDPTRIGVAGDSAGGCLAAVAAQQLAAKDGPKAAFQVLIYPVVDGTLSSDSVRELPDVYVLPETILAHFRNSYAGSHTDFADPEFSPLFGTNFSDLPDTYILTAGFDPLVDDGIAYAEKLKAAGVKVDYRCFTGQIHGFLSLSKVIPQAMQAHHEIAAWLRAKTG